MDDNIKQEDDVLNDSHIDLEKIREERLQRTREAMMEFDRDIAISVIPDNSPSTSSSVVENAAVCVQKHFRGYLGRKLYREKLLEQYEKDEEERLKRQKQQTEEAELLVEMARLQLEAEEDNTIHRNRQRMLNVCATRIQRAWRRYTAGRPTHHTRHSDSFEEQVYQATGLSVTDIITGNATLTNTEPNQQPETILTGPNENSSILHGNETDNQACVPEALVEDTREANLHVEEVMQDTKESSPTVVDAVEDNLVVEDISESSCANVDTSEEVHQKDDAIVSDSLQENGSTSNDNAQEKDAKVDDNVKEKDSTTSSNVIAQKGDRKVRFNLQNSEDKEDSTVTQSNLQSTYNKLLPFTEDKKSDSDFFSLDEVSFTMPAEQVKLLGYTQLRELKCSLETKLGLLSDQLIMELQSRERLIAHKDFLLEKIQNLSKLVQNQHKINQKQRKRIKSSGH